MPVTRHCDPGRVPGEAIQHAVRQSGLLRRFAPHNEDLSNFHSELDNHLCMIYQEETHQ